MGNANSAESQGVKSRNGGSNGLETAIPSLNRRGNSNFGPRESIATGNREDLSPESARNSFRAAGGSGSNSPNPGHVSGTSNNWNNSNSSKDRDGGSEQKNMNLFNKSRPSSIPGLLYQGNNSNVVRSPDDFQTNKTGQFMSLEIGGSRSNSNSSSEMDCGKMSVRAAIDTFIENCLSAKNENSPPPGMNLSSITGIINKSESETNNEVSSKESICDNKASSECQIQENDTDNDNAAREGSSVKSNASDRADGSTSTCVNSGSKINARETIVDIASDSVDVTDEGGGDNVLVIDCSNEERNDNEKEDVDNDGRNESCAPLFTNNSRDRAKEIIPKNTDGSSNPQDKKSESPNLSKSLVHVIDVDSEDFETPPSCLQTNKVKNEKSFSEFLQDRLLAQIEANEKENGNTNDDRKLSWPGITNKPPSSSVGTLTSGPVRLQTLIDKVLDQSLNKDCSDSGQPYKPLVMPSLTSPSSSTSTSRGYAPSMYSKPMNKPANININTMSFKDHVEKVLEESFKLYDDDDDDNNTDKCNEVDKKNKFSNDNTANNLNSADRKDSPDVEVINDRPGSGNLQQSFSKKPEGGRVGPDGTISVQDIVDRVISQTEVISKLLTPGPANNESGRIDPNRSSAGNVGSVHKSNDSSAPINSVSNMGKNHPSAGNFNKAGRSMPPTTKSNYVVSDPAVQGSTPKVGPTGRKRGRPRLSSPNHNRNPPPKSSHPDPSYSANVNGCVVGTPSFHSSAQFHQLQQRMSYPHNLPPSQPSQSSTSSSLSQSRGALRIGQGPPSLDYISPHGGQTNSNRISAMPPLVTSQGSVSTLPYQQQLPHGHQQNPQGYYGSSSASRSSPISSSYHRGGPHLQHPNQSPSSHVVHQIQHPSHHRPGSPTSRSKHLPPHRPSLSDGKPPPLLILGEQPVSRHHQQSQQLHHHSSSHNNSSRFGALPHTPNPSCPCESCVETFSRNRSRSPLRHISPRSSSSAYPPNIGQLPKDQDPHKLSSHSAHLSHPYHPVYYQGSGRNDSNPLNHDASCRVLESGRQESLKPVIRTGDKNLPPQAIVPSYVVTQRQINSENASHPNHSEDHTFRRGSSFTRTHSPHNLQSGSPYISSRPSEDGDRPMDLHRSRYHSPHNVTPVATTSPAGDDQPLDLSVKSSDCAPKESQPRSHDVALDRCNIRRPSDSSTREIPCRERRDQRIPSDPSHSLYYRDDPTYRSERPTSPQSSDHSQCRSTTPSYQYDQQQSHYYHHQQASPSLPHHLPGSKLTSPHFQPPSPYTSSTNPDQPKHYPQHPHQPVPIHNPSHLPYQHQQKTSESQNSSSSTPYSQYLYPGSAQPSQISPTLVQAQLPIPPHIRVSHSPGSDTSSNSGKSQHQHLNRNSPLYPTDPTRPSIVFKNETMPMPRLYQPHSSVPRSTERLPSNLQHVGPSPTDNALNSGSLPSPQSRVPPPLLQSQVQQSSPQPTQQPQNPASDDPDGSKHVSRHEPIQNIIGNHAQSDILYLICKLCRQTYGSPYGFRKHFRNQHGFEPKVEHAIVQTISATKAAINYNTEGVVYEEALKPVRPNELQDDNHLQLSVVKTEAGGLSPVEEFNPSQLAAYNRAQEDAKLLFKAEKDATAPAGNAKYLECAQCGQTFQLNDFGSYTRHCRQHSMSQNAGPFSCHDCHQSFAEPGHLEQHLNTHNTFTPSVCGICRTFFSSPYYLAEHLQAAHGHVLPSEVKKQSSVSTDAKQEGNQSLDTQLKTEKPYTPPEKDSAQKPQNPENPSSPNSYSLKRNSPSLSSFTESSLPPSKRRRSTYLSADEYGSKNCNPTNPMLMVVTPKELEIQKRPADPVVSSTSPDSSYDDQSSKLSSTSNSNLKDTVSSVSSNPPAASKPQFDIDDSKLHSKSPAIDKANISQGTNKDGDLEMTSDRCPSTDSNSTNTSNTPSMTPPPGFADDVPVFYKHKKYSRHLKRGMSGGDSGASNAKITPTGGASNNSMQNNSDSRKEKTSSTSSLTSDAVASSSSSSTSSVVTSSNVRVEDCQSSSVSPSLKSNAKSPSNDSKDSMNEDSNNDDKNISLSYPKPSRRAKEQGKRDKKGDNKLYNTSKDNIDNNIGKTKTKSNDMSSRRSPSSPSVTASPPLVKNDDVDNNIGGKNERNGGKKTRK